MSAGVHGRFTWNNSYYYVEEWRKSNKIFDGRTPSLRNGVRGEGWGEELLRFFALVVFAAK